MVLIAKESGHGATRQAVDGKVASFCSRVLGRLLDDVLVFLSFMPRFFICEGKILEFHSIPVAMSVMWCVVILLLRWSANLLPRWFFFLSVCLSGFWRFTEAVHLILGAFRFVSCLVSCFCSLMGAKTTFWWNANFSFSCCVLRLCRANFLCSYAAECWLFVHIFLVDKLMLTLTVRDFRYCTMTVFGETGNLDQVKINGAYGCCSFLLWYRQYYQTLTH